MAKAFTGHTTVSSLEEALGTGHSGPVPGLVLIFAGRAPLARVVRLQGQSIDLGRTELSASEAMDSGISRQHVRFVLDDAGFRVSDLGSRNGTYVAARRIESETRIPSGSVVRVGGSLLLTVSDIRPFDRHGLGNRNGTVGGPALRQAFDAIALNQSVGMVSTLLLTGESGTGKELAAKAFHAGLGKPSAPFSAVNCAAIPKDLAERLLFGSCRGAFSGATDAKGHVQAAHGGSLFLDEVGELSLDVQSKLLRMLETREVLRLGATSYEQVDVRVCAATWRNLRDEVAAGRFREDLYFRIGQPEIRLPPLRERLEEVPWHIQQVLDECSRDRTPICATASFVEACALRNWPGNVRELRAEVRRAAASALARHSEALKPADLSPTAGEPIRRAEAGTSAAPIPEDEVAAALLAASGNVLAAARHLGVDRGKIRRWLERHSIEPSAFKRS
ncbi:MAG TPA: sigma 54-interacting transcriptional regulator [Polyangiaceae bacterium]|nr:sigma 54-interacting transcriptional regulator [Polyangiaceae bacterium]